VADRILGTQFLADIAEFFILFQSMYAGFVERARSVQRLLADRRTSFIVVSTLETVPLREAEYFAQAISERKLHLGAIVLNKVLPEYLREPKGAVVAEKLRDRAEEIADAIAPELAGAEPAQIRRVLTEIGQNYMDYRIVAQSEAEKQAELSTAAEILVSVPYYETDVHDFAGLMRLGAGLWEE
jgi:anion-transporting  ArsA/GET3 family ATPase